MTKPKPDTRLTIRFKPEEYADLQAKAGDQALSAYVRNLALECATSSRAKRMSKPIKDHTALAQIMALIGKLGAYAVFSKVENAIALDLIDLSDEERADFLAAADDLRSIKALLMKMLGVKVR